MISIHICRKYLLILVTDLSKHPLVWRELASPELPLDACDICFYNHNFMVQLSKDSQATEVECELPLGWTLHFMFLIVIETQ